MARGSEQRVGNAPGAPSAADVAGELLAWAAGGGIIALALFPFAIPLVVLTAVAFVPLVLVALVGGLVVLLLAPPFLAVRGVVRRAKAVRAQSQGARRPASARRAPVSGQELPSH
jgi:hypothetical protein